MDAGRDPADSLGLDPDAVAVGRREIARIKAELGRRAARPRQRAEPVERVERIERGVEPMSVDRMSAEMASAAERDHLLERVRRLEAEVAQLREAMASILETAAQGVRPRDQA